MLCVTCGMLNSLVNNKAARREQTCFGGSRARLGDISIQIFADGRLAFFAVTVQNAAQANYVVKLLQWQGKWKRIVNMC